MQIGELAKPPTPTPTSGRPANKPTSGIGIRPDSTRRHAVDAHTKSAQVGCCVLRSLASASDRRFSAAFQSPWGFRR